ncbi:MAG TPA: cysteine--tRNA ligase [Candidatus Vogelbacteria bacterium]|nr:cysteine--tRNA ligase [Candidatus Vogelbacteria bacterium]
MKKKENSLIEIRFFNTLSRQVEIFKTNKPKEVSIYTCGPTVYNYAHIGNFRSYFLMDIIRRFFSASNFKVNLVMNITDIDDKTIRDSQKAGKSLKVFTGEYTKVFFSDLEKLNIKKPKIICRATDNIEEMVDFINELKKKGFAYQGTDGSIYFSLKKDKDYGELANIKKSNLKINADRRLNLSDEYSKEELNDFVLWKAWKPEDGKVFWQTKLGKGRPGWHIECSVMSRKYLGDNFDLHLGGEDLVFPHHTNEIAQSKALTGKIPANYWLHNAFLKVDGQKMSKSLNNFYTLPDLEKNNFNPLYLRVLFLGTHYRKTFNFSFKDKEKAEGIIRRFNEFLAGLEFYYYRSKKDYGQIDEILRETKEEFINNLANDLNTVKALATVFIFIDKINKINHLLSKSEATRVKKFIDEVDEVFGFINIFYEEYTEDIRKIANNSEFKKLLKDRQKARRDKDYVKADEIRFQFEKRGIAIKDLKEGIVLQKIDDKKICPSPEGSGHY